MRRRTEPGRSGTITLRVSRQGSRATILLQVDNLGLPAMQENFGDEMVGPTLIETQL